MLVPSCLRRLCESRTVLLFISRHAQAFVANGGPSIVKNAARLHGPGRGLVSVQREYVLENAQRMDTESMTRLRICFGAILRSWKMYPMPVEQTVQQCARAPLPMQLRSYCICCCTCFAGNKKTKALCVLDDYQQNPDGLAEGDVVKVIDAELKFYHIMKFKVTIVVFRAGSHVSFSSTLSVPEFCLRHVIVDLAVTTF